MNISHGANLHPATGRAWALGLWTLAPTPQTARCVRLSIQLNFLGHRIFARYPSEKWFSSSFLGARHLSNRNAATTDVLNRCSSGRKSSISVGFTATHAAAAKRIQHRKEASLLERTLSIIKPDATRRNLTGKINAMLEDSGLRIVGQKRIKLTPAQAGEFYKIHKDRPFFSELCDYMVSGPVIVQVLEGDDAIKKNRDVMGATNPADAAEGTIRKTFAVSLSENSVHGSDGPDTAATEIAFFFAKSEIVG